MKILVVSQYFWPEPFIINQLVDTLARQGHDITVFTGKPNYPDGRIYEGFDQKGESAETFHDSVKVYRIPLRPRFSASSINLALNYLSFIYSGLRCFPRLSRHLQADAILVFAPSPITSAIPAILIKFLRKWHLAIWVQDLWPESLAATGHVRNTKLLKAIGWLVKWIYSRADTLLIQSRAFKDPVGEMACAEKIVYYPNSILKQSFDEKNDGNLPATLLQQLKSSFSVVFAGNLGRAQSLETIIEAAKQLNDIPDVRFFLIGSGSMSDWLAQQKVKYGLDNVVIAGRFPMDMMPNIYAHADALLVTLTRDEIFALTVPSKIQAYLAAGKPIIAAVDGEGGRVVLEANAGLVSPAEDVHGLLSSIRTLTQMSPEERSELGENAQEYFNQHFEMEGQARKLIEILSSRLPTVTERG